MMTYVSKVQVSSDGCRNLAGAIDCDFPTDVKLENSEEDDVVELPPMKNLHIFLTHLSFHFLFSINNDESPEKSRMTCDKIDRMSTNE